MWKEPVFDRMEVSRRNKGDFNGISRVFKFFCFESDSSHFQNGPCQSDIQLQNYVKV